MKVLFAVNNEEVSESIVKKYQKKYKEIISYKNVYYFNAILKEIQKDKTYDRIVISEDLEQFTNTSYEQMDKFIFERLDSISDEASNLKGEDIPIILICTERRNKSEEILVKLFGIGIYNAIIGNDRSIDEVCRLINKPRLKKEAKTYYQIDTDNVSYKAENEDDVSEAEIQNILAHFKRLGKNEEKYIESYNSIAGQYNDKQLKVISMVLPLNVRAVLEEQSPKYQQVMSFNKAVSKNLRIKKQSQEDGLSQKLLTNPKKINTLERPIVIPSTMKSADNAIKLTRTANKRVTPQIEENDKKEEQIPIYEELIENEESKQEVVQEEPIKPKRRGRPRKNPLPEEDAEPKPKRGRGRPRKNPLPEEVEELKIEEQEDDEELILPGMTENNENVNNLENIQNEENTEDEDVILPMSNLNEQISNEPNKEIQNEVEQNIVEEEQENDEPLSIESTIQRQPEFSRPVVQQSGITSTTNDYTYSENSHVDLSGLLQGNKKVAAFVGTSKNGTSFIVNNLAEMLSSTGINVAILDTTKNRNSYYIYTKKRRRS